MRKKVLKITGFSLLLIIFVISLYRYLSNWKTVQEISARFQITPSWDAIRDHLFEEFKPGMTREEVHSILEKVGSWKIVYIEPTNQGRWDWQSKQYLYPEYLIFLESPAVRNLHGWLFQYDQNGRLVEHSRVDS